MCDINVVQAYVEFPGLVRFVAPSHHMFRWNARRFLFVGGLFEKAAINLSPYD